MTDISKIQKCDKLITHSEDSYQVCDL